MITKPRKPTAGTADSGGPNIIRRPDLDRQIQSLKADLEQALSLLAEYQWAVDGECPECRNDAHFNHGHHPDCTWANLLKKYNREVQFAHPSNKEEADG